ncbi:MAG: hypothetical protein SGARI_007829, partial [Bacillariaceae sp.]
MEMEPHALVDLDIDIIVPQSSDNFGNSIEATFTLQNGRDKLKSIAIWLTAVAYNGGVSYQPPSIHGMTEVTMEGIANILLWLHA